MVQNSYQGAIDVFPLPHVFGAPRHLGNTSMNFAILTTLNVEPSHWPIIVIKIFIETTIRTNARESYSNFTDSSSALCELIT